MEWEPIITTEFWKDFNGLSSDVTNRAKHAMNRMLADPWAPELHPEKVQAAETGVHSCRVDGNYRIIWKFVKPKKIIFLILDKHNPSYQRARRKSFTLDRSDVVVMKDVLEVGAKPAEALFGVIGDDKNKLRPGKLFIGFADKEIRGWGVPETLLANIRAMDNLDELGQLEKSQEMPSDVFDRLLEIALSGVERPIVPDHKLDQSLDRNQGGEELYKFLNGDEFRRVLEGSLEDWMLFLAPFQRSLTTREFSGPARLRGVSGSGKTVIALHRARYLAGKVQGTNQKVLFLTYGNRLPDVMRHLYAKLVGPGSPDANAIECMTIHQLCLHLLRTGCVQVSLEANVLDSYMKEAIQHVASSGAKSKILNRTSQFFKDEIRYTIKGRNVQSLDSYLALKRTGRGSALGDDERRVVFAVYQQYQCLLQAAGQCDFDDVLLLTLRAFDEKRIPGLPYQHVIVDEIQDLSEITLNIIRRLVPNSKNDLFLVGDGLQRIYAGGYSLPELGIEVSGRSALLRRNYRNTQQILRTAFAMMKDIEQDDMDSSEGPSVEPEYSVRQGPPPVLKGFPSPELEVKWLKGRIEELQRSHGYKPGDFGILYRMSPIYPKLLERTWPGALAEISKDAGSYFSENIKYTTFHSAKGLEFKVVFIVGVTDGQFVPRDDWSLEGGQLKAYLENEKRLLYVAMTRARDQLYVTYSRGQPSRFLESVPADYWST